jgi:hypothetical protein
MTNAPVVMPHNVLETITGPIYVDIGFLVGINTNR